MNHQQSIDNITLRIRELGGWAELKRICGASVTKSYLSPIIYGKGRLTDTSVGMIRNLLCMKPADVRGHSVLEKWVTDSHCHGGTVAMVHYTRLVHIAIYIEFSGEFSGEFRDAVKLSFQDFASLSMCAADFCKDKGVAIMRDGTRLCYNTDGWMHEKGGQ
jgi:hypothetical protein